ncbi:hypothetical protein H2201_001324 [Coniosporium apollinis]|uniref:Uncharacterized protein n=2 Tax=Coniosporium TaxID=2810619 RepID=A0ABQ9P3V8_9PEZI|nr:hypothetical protein H2199_001734 [Cladosporium sp. JES 115]KAJ9668681.1 hypothetical protein H2201_001324 [Coniosporium apollinis]
MQLTSFLLIALAPAALAREVKRQAIDEAAFSSAAGQLISLYIPPSVASAIYSAASAASVTGDPNSIIQSALTATASPTWLTAVPTEYQPNLNSLDSEISALRGAAATGIPGADRVTTITDSAGSAVTSIIPGSSVASSAGTLTDAAASSASSVSISNLSSEPHIDAKQALSQGSALASSLASSLSSSVSAAVSSLESSASGATSSAASTETATESTTSTSTEAVTSSAAAESTSSAFAAPTQLPMAAAGALGFLGVVLAL